MESGIFFVASQQVPSCTCIELHRPRFCSREVSVHPESAAISAGRVFIRYGGRRPSMRQLLQPPSPVVPLEPALRRDRWRPVSHPLRPFSRTTRHRVELDSRSRESQRAQLLHLRRLTLPILASVLGLGGGMLTAHRLRRTPLLQEARRAVDDLLVVVVPTIVRKDTCTALERCAAICAALAMGSQLCSNTSNRSPLLTQTERTPGTGRIAIRHVRLASTRSPPWGWPGGSLDRSESGGV
jgi:hypothetical protein